MLRGLSDAACLIVPFCVQLAELKELKLDSVRHFILDECDKVLDTIGESTPFSFQAAHLQAGICTFLLQGICSAFFSEELLSFADTYINVISLSACCD